MLTHHQPKQWALRLLGPCLLAAALAACSGGHEVIYRCDGTAEEVNVTYRDAEGETVEETVGLPWETTFTVSGSAVRTDLTAENPGSAGEMDCEAVVDGNPIDGSAEAAIEIDGMTTFSGNSSESSYDIRTRDRSGFELANDSPGAVCGLYLTPAGEDWDENLLADEPLDEGASRMVTFEFEGGEYYFRVDTCDEALTFVHPIEVPTVPEGMPVFRFDTGGNVSRLIVTNASSGDLCGLFVRGRDGDWSGSLLADGQPLAPGESKPLLLPRGVYWFRAETCDGDVAEVEDFGFSGSIEESRWLLTDDLASGRRVTITNAGDEELCEHYMAAEGEDWGENLLADYPIPGGGQTIVTYGVDAESYDLKTHLCDGSLIAFQTGTSMPDGPAVAATINPREDRPTLTLDNESSYDICGIHLDLGGGYLRNLLVDGEPVASGDTWSAILNDSTFSFQILTCDGDSDEARNVDMSQGDQTLTFQD